ncbi:acyltransferase family protein [Micromonospora inositola]|uniref:Peptidoglycan/LPS O-acetylase OafA/YrhL, contains acyltransferase and SGNH-hydrolase domains n=1 Tax=Micromonospora inositola TaxID=47865 RepID=A0A1C5JE00_9ACTN|nr:acyltransferase [Micromonospora inositola]SCG68752.1 Peptidoglycan/LPS O-acetylase OafA/YrhL, contains acyltransferase and SGNH-hydrolase domains [Micromonospora inositola]
MLAGVRARQTIAAAFSSADNSFGLLRLMFAFAVLVSHSLPIGFGQDDPGGGLTNGQTGLGDIGILGFFVISGFLITRSGARVPVLRYLWHRGLRILPGLWVCLVVTAFVFAPIVSLSERGSLHGLFSDSDGPFQYILSNSFVAIWQYGISGLLLDTPYGQRTGTSVFNGSLWSLIYEVLCYLLVAGLAAIGVLRRARWLVAMLVLAGAGVMVHDLLRAPEVPGPQGVHGPVFGVDGLDTYSLVYLTYVFLLGAACQLYRERIVLNDGLAVVAAAVVVATTQLGAFAVLGYPAFAYLVLWLAVRLPRWSRRIGRRHDYSYGFYIYAFPVQQLLALLGVPRLGLVPYIAVCAIATLALAVPSWHVVERPAMSLKAWSPRRGEATASVPRPATDRRAPKPDAEKVPAAVGADEAATVRPPATRHRG